MMGVNWRLGTGAAKGAPPVCGATISGVAGGGAGGPAAPGMRSDIMRDDPAPTVSTGWLW